MNKYLIKLFDNENICKKLIENLGRRHFVVLRFPAPNQFSNWFGVWNGSEDQNMDGVRVGGSVFFEKKL